MVVVEVVVLGPVVVVQAQVLVLAQLQVLVLALVLVLVERESEVRYHLCIRIMARCNINSGIGGSSSRGGNSSRTCRRRSFTLQIWCPRALKLTVGTFSTQAYPLTNSLDGH